ncbi:MULTISPECIES: PTS sugar transporter subunit IIA [Arthrobacter]|uniref:PTS glucose transporter subunit IIA n=1 Tax=Arthrobacter psychrochitiniphilus TaxID=291045 RepID=A0A2V3DVB8_9MICC|nr:MULTISPECIES: PTS glucose transporter subunit IIA [Arthrobacter]NYG18598.1 glucose-specific phosphotransferase system IIA component [Arthrobacter psychrochitiniphilus]PXA66449.1 PTS glucose transporter subunit IIA [Arthrobacter psychrochitiniphilus]
MLKMFKKKGEQIFSPAEGTVMALADVPDPVFASGAVGAGFAVEPSEGSFRSPVDGELILVAKTLHAFAVRTDAGAEILVHIGMDTVKLKGQGFTGHRVKGDRVQKGDLIISCDLAQMSALVPSMVTPVLLTNGTAFAIAETEIGADNSAPVLTVRKK